VHSARYAENDHGRITRLLAELVAANGSTNPELGQGNRQAEFVAALAVADPSGAIQLEVEGHCPGEILTSRRGEGGFGYDPVFYVPEAGQTFAEMSKELKGRIGHRGRAFELLQPRLLALFS
jgi:XTP/dITP diphosphohydrolase